MLCVVPVFRALKGAFPSARVTLVGLPWAASFAARYFRYIDEFIPFPGHPALPERVPDPAAWDGFIRSVRDRRPDLAIQLHGSGPIVNGIVESFGAARNAGFTVSPDDHHGDGTWVPWPETGHEILRFLAVVTALGIPLKGTDLEFPFTPGELAEWRALAAERGLTAGRYVCVHPGARLRSRRWAPERFARVADRLAAEGWTIVLTGSGEETALTATVARAMTSPAIDLAGKTSLGGMAAVIANARLLVANDTGVSHIAAATRTPSVIVTTGSDPARWAPIDSTRHVPVFEPVSCRPCAFETCPIGHPCATTLSADRVTERAIHILTRSPECALSAS